MFEFVSTTKYKVGSVKSTGQRSKCVICHRINQENGTFLYRAKVC